MTKNSEQKDNQPNFEAFYQSLLKQKPKPINQLKIEDIPWFKTTDSVKIPDNIILASLWFTAYYKYTEQLIDEPEIFKLELNNILSMMVKCYLSINDTDTARYFLQRLTINIGVKWGTDLPESGSYWLVAKNKLWHRESILSGDHWTELKEKFLFDFVAKIAKEKNNTQIIANIAKHTHSNVKNT